MLGGIVQHFEGKVKEKEAEWVARLKQDFCYEAVEREVLGLTREFFSEVMEQVLKEVLADREVLEALKRFGGKLAYRFVSYQEVEVTVGNGRKVKVRSPYFVKARSKRGKQKRGPNGRGCHLLLEVLGFLGRCSSLFVDEVVKMALLCPSFAVAHEVLSSRGMEVDVKTLRRLCRLLGVVGLEHRGAISLESGEDVSGKTVVIGIDGGRLRTRRKKRGRRAAGLKRSGFSTPWREPKLFTIYVLDAEGCVEKTWTPVHDATLGDADAVFSLLAAYLRKLRIEQAGRVVFVGDGAEWIWTRVSRLIEELSLDSGSVFEVVDYFHATSHLWKLVEMREDLSSKEQKRLYAQWKRLLWEGDVEGLKQEVARQVRGKVRKQILRGLKYFQTHASRMQYARFKAEQVPQGSGSVESAIRRVINLRMKAPGTFWSPAMAEYFLFLRSQLISGRWAILMHWVAGRRRDQWEELKGMEGRGSGRSHTEEKNFRYKKTGTYDS